MYPYKIRLESENSALLYAKMEYRDNKVYEHLIKRLSEYLIVEHKFQLTGTIQGFERRVLRDVSLRCVDIIVSEIKFMESKKVHEKLQY